MSADQIQFETPENVQLSYQPGGLGSRFVAWVTDQLLLTISMFVLFLLLAICGVLSSSAALDVERYINQQAGDKSAGPDNAMMVVVGICMLIWGLGSFFYFTLSELCLRGQTLGKRSAKLRVVKQDGFALDAVSVLVRNIFRVVDNLPPLWLVPLISKRGQRFGDMVAGTLVISDEVAELIGMREVLSERKAVDAVFRFDAGMLKKLRPDDLHAVEQMLERGHAVEPIKRQKIALRLVSGLCERMCCDAPPEAQRMTFMEDLLAAEYRRQSRHLG